jgi:hypothetical protein
MPDPTHEPEYDTLPPAIVDALREIDGPAVMPDAQRDADVFSGARRHLAGANRKRRNIRLFIGGSVGGGLAAAAMLGIAFVLGDPTGQNEPQADYAMQPATQMDEDESAGAAAPSADAFVSGDLNANGELDILDAYLLARRLDSGRTPSPASDANADGQINQADVDWIAARAVALNPGEQG